MELILNICCFTLWPLLHDSGTIYTNISNLSIWFHQTEDDQMYADSSCDHHSFFGLSGRHIFYAVIAAVEAFSKSQCMVIWWEKQGVKPFLVSYIYKIEILKIDLPQIHHVFWCLIAFLLLLDLLKIDRYKSISIVEAVGNPVCFACSSPAINLNRTWFNCTWDLLLPIWSILYLPFSTVLHSPGQQDSISCEVPCSRDECGFPVTR